MSLLPDLNAPEYTDDAPNVPKKPPVASIYELNTTWEIIGLDRNSNYSRGTTNYGWSSTIELTLKIWGY